MPFGRYSEGDSLCDPCAIDVPRVRGARGATENDVEGLIGLSHFFKDLSRTLGKQSFLEMLHRVQCCDNTKWGHSRDKGM